MESLADSTLALRSTLAAVRELSPDTVAELQAVAEAHQLKSGEALFLPGQDFKQAIFTVVSGDLELQRPGEPPFVLEEGDVVGLDNYFDNAPYTAAATALNEVVVAAIPAAKLRDIETRHPELFRAVSRMLTQRMRLQAQRRQQATGVWALPARAVMKSPLVTCNPDTRVMEAFRLMRDRRIGSLAVVDRYHRLQGVITFASLSEGLVRQTATPADPIGDSVCAQAHQVDADTPLWKVETIQRDLGVKYLIVLEDGRPAGIVSQTDVLQALVSHQRSVIAEINDAPDFAALKAFNQRVGQIAAELRHHNRNARQAVRALSEVHLAIQRRCIGLVVDQMRSEGLGAPPVPFAFLIMGSGGRKEMIVRTDQDNGIILADTPYTTLARTRAWFTTFCDRANHRLDEVGYEWCSGDIMARNPDFHKSLSQWRQQLSHITALPTEKAARWSTIFFDFDTLYGDDRLTVALRGHLLNELKKQPRLLTLMVEDDATGRPALGLFNRLVTASDKDRRGRIDLKRNGTRLLADAARIYALSEGIDATNTTDRLRALVRAGRLDPEFVESALAAYDELLDLTLNHQIEQVRAGRIPDKLVDPEDLTPLEMESLRMAMRVIKRLQGRMQGEFGTVML